VMGSTQRKARVFELAAEFAHAEAMGEGRVDVEGFAGDGALALGREVLEGAHVVQRSASLMRTTRTSLTIARSILRTFSAWRSSRLANWILSILVTPSTMGRPGSPNLETMSSVVTGVSSTASWRRPAAMAVESSFISAEDEGDLQRMEDVGLAGGAELTVMVLEAELPGLADDVGVVGGTIGVDGVQEPAKLLP